MPLFCPKIWRTFCYNVLICRAFALEAKMILPLCLTLLAAVATEQEKPKPAENSLCPVMKQKVTEKSQVVVVKDREYRICCPGCGPKIEKDPDKYLNPDGSVKAEKKVKEKK
jgi:hypothetical protein